MLSKHWLPHLDLRAENSPPPGHLVARAGLEPLPEFPAPAKQKRGAHGGRPRGTFFKPVLSSSSYCLLTGPQQRKRHHTG